MDRPNPEWLLLIVGTAPLLIVAMDVLVGTFHPERCLRPRTGNALHFWIQDFIVLTVGAGVAMFFDDVHEPFPMLIGLASGTVGFLFVANSLTQPVFRAFVLIVMLFAGLVNFWVLLVAVFAYCRMRSGFRIECGAPPTRRARIAAFASFALYAASFFFNIRDGTQMLTGHEAYTWALEGATDKLLSTNPINDSFLIVYLWSANLLYWCSLYTLLQQRHWRALLESLIGTGCSLLYIIYEGPPSGFSPAYYMWVGSIVLPAGFAAYALATAGRRVPEPATAPASPN